MQIEGIGSKRADSIIRHRQKHGPFLTLEDLERVPSLTKHIVESIVDHLDWSFNGHYITPPQIIQADARHLHSIPHKKPVGGDTIRNWFDFMILDEASQLDVATSTLIFTKRATGCSCVLAGDDLQLPPIHQADPPEDLDDIVGSIYNYFCRYHKIEPKALNINYRSNQPIVDFTMIAGYKKLESYSPDLQLDFRLPINDERPENWPDTLYWATSWKELLDPLSPTVSFVYEDVLSSQVNEFEADAVAAMIWLLRERLTNQLKNEQAPGGTFQAESQVLYDAKEFWDKAVGVVTPH